MDIVAISKRVFGIARRHLDDALRECDLIQECWASICEAEGFDSSIIEEDGIHGRLDVFAEWPGSSLRDANDAAHRFSDHLNRAFDTAILAAAARVSGVIEDPDPEDYRMPLFKNREGLASCIAGGSLRGLRPDQIRVIEQFQPYRVSAQEKRVHQLIRVLSRYLNVARARPASAA